MEKTTRRHLLKAAAVGGVTAAGLGTVLGSGRGIAAKEQLPGAARDHAHDNNPFTGPRPLAVVSFGQWDADPDMPFDRQPWNSDRARNIHRVLPFEVEVDAGGAVSFIISGVHQILIYGNGRTYEDIEAAWTAANRPTIVGGPGLVDHASDRVYRGLDPRIPNYVLVPPPPPPTPPAPSVQDRIESVNFKEPGRYLVVCGVVPHFIEKMHGYVTVHA